MARVPSIELIRERLTRHRPIEVETDESAVVAAVALLVHQPAGLSPELLFIERAIRDGDPWSGQMAFPGGHRDPDDVDLAATAARETLEEVGIPLGAPVGRIDDFSGSRDSQPRRVVVSPFVYLLGERPRIRTNREVRTTVWVPLRHILDPSSAVNYRFARSEFSGTFPGVEYQGQVVWGLTHRVLASFLELLDCALPDPPPLPSGAGLDQKG